jgi:hypothetical protein
MEYTFRSFCLFCERDDYTLSESRSQLLLQGLTGGWCIGGSPGRRCGNTLLWLCFEEYVGKKKDAILLRREEPRDGDYEGNFRKGLTRIGLGPVFYPVSLPDLPLFSPALTGASSEVIPVRRDTYGF